MVRRKLPISELVLVLNLGYYDQAHFNREFRALAARTPTVYLAQLRADTAGTGMSGNDGPASATAQTSKTIAGKGS